MVFPYLLRSLIFILSSQAVELLTKHPAVRQLVQEEHQYLLVDEFQDVNPVQVGS